MALTSVLLRATVRSAKRVLAIVILSVCLTQHPEPNQAQLR